MSLKNLPPISLFFQLLLLLAALVASASGQCCVGFSGGVCISCPSGMHLYRGNCIYDLVGCLSYLSGFDCAGCSTNYHLLNGSCVHDRFSPSLANGTNFTVYLDSALKPDPQMAAAHHALENSTQLWLDWYNYTLQLSHTILNGRALVKQASNLMSVATASSKIHYILRGSMGRGNDTLLLYRFIYELSSGSGFVDCLVVVEVVDGVQNYLELNAVRMSKVSGEEGWAQIRRKGVEEAYLLEKLGHVFPKITGYGYLKGYCREVEEAVNCTLFFMSNQLGVTSFVYLAEKGEIPQSNISNTTNITTTQSSPSNRPNNTAKTVKQDQNASNQTNANSKQISNNRTAPNLTSQQQLLPSQKSASVQNMLNISNLNKNPIFNAGYAVIVQQYGLSPSCSILQLFSISASPTIYGFYLQDAQASMYYRFAFTVDLANGLFQILNYTQSSQPLVVNPAPNASNNTNPNNSNSKKNNSDSRSDGQKNNATAPVVNVVPHNSSVVNVVPHNSSAHFCGKAAPQFVDITMRQTSDIFLPKINLILHAMYESMLVNTRISSAKYSLALDPSASSSNITYLISYVNMDGTPFNFEVAIVNNEFHLLTSPTTTTLQPEPKLESRIDTKNATVNETTLNNTKQRQNATQTKVDAHKPSQTPNTGKHNEDNLDSTHNQHKNTRGSNQTNNSTANQSTTINNRPSNDSEAKTNNSIPTTTNTSAHSAYDSSNAKSAVNESQTSRPIDIPPKNYTAEPKYKSLISIVRSIYRIPMNATVMSVQLSNQTVGDNRYEIVFRMNYAKQLPDSTIAKISTYNLSVNPSSFVSVQSEKIQYIKADTQENTDPSSRMSNTQAEKPRVADNSSDSTPNPLPQQKSVLSSPSLALLGTAPSPYLRNLYQIFSRHSPSLGSFGLQSLNISASNASAALISYTQKVQFSKQGQKMCFSVFYEAASLKKGPNVSSSNSFLINLLEYHVVNCSKQNLASLPASAFANQSVPNLAVNAQISAIAKNRALTFTLYQQWGSLYRVRFVSATFGEREMLIDSASMLVLSYTASPQPIYSQQIGNSFIAANVVEALRSNMQKIFKLIPQTLSIEWIGRSNDDNILLLQIVAKTQIQTQWSQPVYQHFVMRALYWNSQNFIKIVGATALDLFSAQYSLNLTLPDKWREVRATQTFTDLAFSPVMPSLIAAYTGFLQNSQIIAIYRDSEGGNSTLKEYLSAANGGRLLVAISKKFSDSYRTAYLLTISFKSAANQSHILNIETLQLSSSVVINGCSSLQHSSSAPQCESCRQGYRLSNGFCLSKIQGCLEYAQQLCIRCAQGYLMSKDLQHCVSQSDQQAFISGVIRAYEAETAH